MTFEGGHNQVGVLALSLASSVFHLCNLRNLWTVLVRSGDGLIPTLPFLLKITAGIQATSQAANRGMMGFGLLQHNNPISANDHKYPVTGFHAQSLASLTRDHDLVLTRNSHFRHHFML